MDFGRLERVERGIHALGWTCERAQGPQPLGNDGCGLLGGQVRLEQTRVKAAPFAATIARLVGHTSSRMVERACGHRNDVAFRNAMTQLPAMPVIPAAGRKWGAGGSSFPETGETQATRSPPQLQEQPVPGAGIEPATRGFSVPGVTPVTHQKETAFGPPERRTVTPAQQRTTPPPPKVGITQPGTMRKVSGPLAALQEKLANTELRIVQPATAQIERRRARLAAKKEPGW